MEVMVVKRDAKTKQALIEYLQQDTDERFWQAITNFAKEHGLSQHFIVTTDQIPEPPYYDLWNQESDSLCK